MAPGRLPTLLHICGGYLPLSEGLTYDLIRVLDGYKHHVIASANEDLQHLPCDNGSVPDPEEGAWEVARAIDARAIVCHLGPQATLGMPIALRLDVPAVTIFHGYDVSRLLRDRRWIARYRAVAALGMRALCVSSAGRTKLFQIGWPESQIEVIHPGVDVARFECKTPVQRWAGRQPRRILMIGQLVERKGVAIALDSVRRLRDASVDIELRIVGDGPLRERLESLLLEWQLSQVSLLGALDHERTLQELAAADIYIQPSITAASGDQEGIPVPLMEAQACGLPVVSTRHAGIPELVIDRQTGLLTDEGDAEGLALAIGRLLNEPGLAERLAQNGRRHVEAEFAWQIQAARFTAYFFALTQASAVRPGPHPTQRPPSMLGLVPHSRPTAH